MTGVTGEPMVNLTSAPDESAALREQYAEITPGYHMNEKHWARSKAATRATTSSWRSW